MEHPGDPTSAPAQAREWASLTQQQQRAWAGFLRTHAAIVRTLDAELERAHGLALTSYDVLVQLAAAPDRRLRMSQLADAVMLTRSGLTRLVDRLEKEGLVKREPCAQDTRSTLAGITPDGLRRLADAESTHVQGIRRCFLGRLADDQIDALAQAWQTIDERRSAGRGD